MDKPVSTTKWSTRALFGAAAVATTFAVAGFIDHLALSYRGSAQQIVKAPAVVVAAKR